MAVTTKVATTLHCTNRKSMSCASRAPAMLITKATRLTCSLSSHYIFAVRRQNPSGARRSRCTRSGSAGTALAAPPPRLCPSTATARSQRPQLRHIDDHVHVPHAAVAIIELINATRCNSYDAPLSRVLSVLSTASINNERRRFSTCSAF